MNNNFFNPYNFQMPNFQMTSGNPNVIYESLSGFQAIKEYQIPCGKVGLLFDNSKNEFYWKDVDSHGMQNLRRFEYKEIGLPADSSVVAESNRQEIELLNQRLAGMESMISQFLKGGKDEHSTDDKSKK